MYDEFDPFKGRYSYFSSCVILRLRVCTDVLLFEYIPCAWYDLYQVLVPGINEAISSLRLVSVSFRGTWSVKITSVLFI